MMSSLAGLKGKLRRGEQIYFIIRHWKLDKESGAVWDFNRLPAPSQNNPNDLCRNISGEISPQTEKKEIIWNTYYHTYGDMTFKLNVDNNSETCQSIHLHVS